MSSESISIPTSISISMDNAARLYEAGKPNEAENVCKLIISKQPSNANALYLLGVIALGRKDHEEAETFMRKAISINKRVAEYHNGLGNVHKMQGNFDLAEKCFRKAIELQPRYADPYANLGVLLTAQKKYQEAANAYRKALELAPGRPEFHRALGALMSVMSKYDLAIEHYNKALSMSQDSQETLIEMVETYKRQRKFKEAIDIGYKAMDINPKNTRLLILLGSIFTILNQYENAIHFFRLTLVLDPDSVTARMGLGMLLHQQGKTAEARECLRAALKLDPENPLVKLNNCMTQIPIIHRSNEEIVRSRENYRKELESLCRSVDLSNPVVLDRAKEMIGDDQPFYLAYQGENDRDLQAMYGDLIVRIQSACFPEWARKQPSPPPIKSGEPIRVGILSAFFYRHSNWKMPIKGWVENLNREEFRLYGYHVGDKSDTQTEIAKKSFYSFTEGLITQDEWLKRITDDRLHVLIIPGIGMDKMTARLAAFRLAPVQCTSWGHPDTTGFKTIDYFLSSDLMEPENGQEHYTEKLVRLPNLSIYYEPLDVDAAPVDRAHFGLRDDLPLFICTQSLFKYLPQYDEVFPRIALETGACQFAFIGYFKSDTLGKRFMQRLETAFSRFGLRMEDYVKMLPFLDAAHYRAFNQLADVFLDSIGWSGCNSTMEALASNLPVVTMPGKLMRGRHTHAILKMMNLSDTECENIDEYVTIAVRLVKDPAWRREISEKIARTKHLAYRDMECIHGLEEFIRQAVAQT